MRRRQGAVSVRARGGEAGQGYDDQRWDSDFGRRRAQSARVLRSL